MAVLTSAPGLRVEIIVNDEPLTEYDNKDDESADAKRVTKYVEARSGQQFAVRISFEKAFPATHDLRYKVWVDGTKVEFSYRTKEELEAHKGVTIDGIVTKAEAGWALLPLQFQRLNIVESRTAESLHVLKDDVQSLGNITVEFGLGYGQETNGEGNLYTLSPRGSLPEEAMKGNAKSCQVTLGASQPVEPSFKCTWRPHQGTMASFNFEYRSKSDLRALHIIPRTPSPSPAPRIAATPLQPRSRSATLPRDEFDGLTEEDIIMIIAEYRGNERGLHALNRTELLAMLKWYRKKAESGVKTERDAENDDEMEIVEAPARKHRHGEDGDVIVLD